MASLGQELRRERELRAIPLKEIANTTKVSFRYLQALEEDRLDILPGPFFIKGAIRAYAETIGVDENYFLNRYHEDMLLQTYTVDKDRKKVEQGGVGSITRRARLYLVLALLSIAAGFLAVFFILKPGAKERRPSVPLPVSSAEVSTPVALPPARNVEAVLPTETGRLTLDLSFTAETWIQVYADGELKLDGVKQAGEKAVCEARKEFLIHTGNAGGIDLTINGKPGKPLGAAGIVRTDIKITPDNYGEFLRPGEKTKGTPAR